MTEQNQIEGTQLSSDEGSCQENTKHHADQRKSPSAKERLVIFACWGLGLLIVSPPFLLYFLPAILAYITSDKNKTPYMANQSKIVLNWLITFSFTMFVLVILLLLNGSMSVGGFFLMGLMHDIELLTTASLASWFITASLFFIFILALAVHVIICLIGMIKALSGQAFNLRVLIHFLK